MPQKAIPFVNQQASGLKRLGGAIVSAMNVMTDQNGLVRRRPGIKAYSGAPTTTIDAAGLSGLYLTLDEQLFAVGASGAERPIYQVTSAGTYKIGGGNPPCGLRGTARPTFCETEILLVIAGGQELQKLDLTTATSDRLGGGPPKATHVLCQSLRLLANDVEASQAYVRYSAPAGGTIGYAGHEQWAVTGNEGGFISPEARPDLVTAIGETMRKVFVWGQSSTQVYVPDGSLITEYLVRPFANASALELGISAVYSPVKVNEKFFWQDSLRRFVSSAGEDFEVISDPIQKDLDAMDVVSDCFGYRVIGGAFDCLVWQYPTDGRAFVFQKGIGWGQWSGWDADRNQWKPLIVTGACGHPSRSDTLVCTSDGRIGIFDLDTATDLGEPINAYIETGYEDRESSTYKWCKSVRLNIRRGQSSGDGDQVVLSYRDREGPWTTMRVSLGARGDTESVVQLDSLGTYRRRQWRFEFAGSAELALVGAIEDYEVLKV